MNSFEKFKYWKDNCKDEKILSELALLDGNDEKIENAFYKDLEFGTAGMRGIIGVGTNCLNVYTVAKVTKGIAKYMNDKGLSSVAICRDCRNFSDEFTFIAARVFAENGIKVILARDIMPTPFLSYIVRECATDIGVMITASHNPSAYNGYKVYNSHGYQITDESAFEIAEYIKNIDIFGIISKNLEYYVSKGEIQYLDENITESYLSAVEKMGINRATGIKIVFSPLNGTGYKLVPEVLVRHGVEYLEIVKEQGYPDGNFPTCKSPNPEKREALDLAIKLAKEINYDLVLATDPDADRIAVAVNNGGDYKLLTGNETGVLLTDYIFSEYKKRGQLPNNPLIIKSIVSTPLAAEITKSYGGQCFDVLTGFKYIGEKITELEKHGEVKRFILGFEESYGYLIGSHVRDKDAVVTSMLIAEMAAEYKRQGMTLVDKLSMLYAKFGTYEHKLISLEYTGAAGSKKMRELLDAFRENIPRVLAESKVISCIDYLLCDTDLPKADVIKLDTEAGSRLIIRPSGTEPLIKFYISASKTIEENKLQLQKITKEIEKRFKN